MDRNQLLTNDDFRDFLIAGAVWRSGLGFPYAVVEAACNLLMVDIETPSLVLIAGLTRQEAKYDLEDLLISAFDELGFDIPPPEADPHLKILGVYGLFVKYQLGKLADWELTTIVYECLGYDNHQLIDVFSYLDNDRSIGGGSHDFNQQFELAGAALRGAAEIIFDGMAKQ